MRRVLTTGALLLCLPASQAGAIDILIDYTYDSNGFFDAGTTDGLAARTTLERAASDFSMLLTDSFSGIVVPDDYISDANGQAPPLSYSWDWDIKFDNPGVNGGPEVVIQEPTFAADEYRIYAGGRSLAGSTLGVGGPGGSSFSAGGSYYLQSELDDINAISAAFADQRDRGQASGFSSWGGTITFDTDAGTNWNYGLDEPVSGESDLYSVAVHELGHALGLGTSDEWNAFISGAFTGANAVAEYGGNVPLDPPTGGHWAEGVSSNVFGNGASQEAAMDPSITNGDRKLFTDLDVAALDDIGWSIDYGFRFLQDSDTPDLNGDGFVGMADLDLLLINWGGAAASPAGGDANGDGTVDSDDLDIVFAAWGDGTPPNNLVPEPGSLAFLGLGGLMLIRRRRSA